MRYSFIVLLSCLVLSTCVKTVSDKIEDKVEIEPPGSYTFSESFIWSYVNVDNIRIQKKDKKSIYVLMSGDQYSLKTNKEKYQSYCDKYDDTGFNKYLDYLSKAVVNGFQSIHVYLDSECIDDEVIIKYSSCKEFINSHYTYPEGVIEGSIADVYSAYVQYDKAISDLKAGDLLLMDTEFVLELKTLQENNKLNIRIEMIGAEGKTLSATKMVQF